MKRTGTFFCVMTTAVSFPRAEMVVCPDQGLRLIPMRVERHRARVINSITRELNRRTYQFPVPLIRIPCNSVYDE